MINIAIVGDIHLHFNEADVTFFNRSDYDLILFVGDLSNYWPRAGLPIARLIAQIDKPVIFIPGNHDTTNIWQLAAEIWQKPWLSWLGAVGQVRRVRALQIALGSAVPRSWNTKTRSVEKLRPAARTRPTAFAGYSVHTLNLKGQRFDLIGARPFSMGGPNLSFKPFMQHRYNVHNLNESTGRLCRCVDQTQSDSLIFLAHNGPTGLSQAPTDIWGRDFKPAGGDFGDPDLEQAITYAKAQDKQVLAVIAGHLHQRTKSGKQRQWLVEKEGTQYINAARVPRIFESGGKNLHHHIRLILDGRTVTVDAVLVPMNRSQH